MSARARYRIGMAIGYALIFGGPFGLGVAVGWWLL